MSVLDKPGYYEQITQARLLLGLGEESTLDEIETRSRALLMQWHPDHGQEDPVLCHEKTLAILDAVRIIKAYCAHYRYSFSRSEVEKYLPMDEWWLKRFGEGAGHS
ncbi:MAG: J domain-containing protein [Magnetococcales bacterium]|nr:J domain-containing protein [Magnetococcales bacterium]